MKWLYKQVFCLEKVIAQDLRLMGQFYKKLLFSLIFFMHGGLKGDNLSKDNSVVASAAGKLFKVTPTEHNFFSFVISLSLENKFILG